MLKKQPGRRYEMDMTEGPILPQVLRYSLPLILSGVLQLLYNAADIVVVGQFAGPNALAAVGSTGSLINLLVNVFMGLSVGVSVVAARGFGAGDATGVRRTTHTAITIAAISGLGVGAFGFTMARPLLELMSSPDGVIDLAALYVRIYFLGMPFNMLFNFGAALLRAIGDTRRPMNYLMLSGLVNVALNLLLVIGFGMDVDGVAIATVASQVVSCALVLNCLLHTDSAVRLDPHALRIHKQELKQIIRIGLPAGLQGSLFSISNVLIQSSVNTFTTVSGSHSLAIAGNSAACNLEGFVYTAMNSLYQADMTFASQNMGARKYTRVRKTWYICTATCATIGLVLGGIFLLFSTQLLSIYNSNTEVIDFGLKRMSIILPTYFLCGMMDVIVGQLRGLGYSVMPMIVSLTGACLLRIVWIMTVFAGNPTPEILYMSYPISWFVTWSTHLVCYIIALRKVPK